MCEKSKELQKLLNLPDLDHSKSAVLNSLPSLNSRGSYEHAIRDFTEWYCSEPWLGEGNPQANPGGASSHNPESPVGLQALLPVARPHSDKSKLDIRVRSQSLVAAQDIGRRHQQPVALGNPW